MGAVYGNELCYNVTIINDNILEEDEVFFVLLSSTEPAFLGSNFMQATVTINHDPANCEYSYVLCRRVHAI